MKNYINKNKKGYGDCQLVSMCNAYYYLTGRRIRQNSREYELFVELVVCRYGAAINIKAIRKLLKLKITRTYDYLPKSKNAFPLEIHTIGSPHGFHSILAVDYKNGKYKVFNFKRVTSNGWISRNQLLNYTTSKGKSSKYICRTIGLSNERA